jgi:hypothetical protein
MYYKNHNRTYVKGVMVYKTIFLSRDMGRGVGGEVWMGRVGVVVGLKELREDESGRGWQDEEVGGEDVCEL